MTTFYRNRFMGVLVVDPYSENVTEAGDLVHVEDSEVGQDAFCSNVGVARELFVVQVVADAPAQILGSSADQRVDRMHRLVHFARGR